MKVVKVLWVDSCNSNINWTVAEDIEAKPMYIDSFGVVIKDTDEFLVIAQNYGNNPEQYSNITTIPNGCIKEVFTIQEDNMYEKEQNSIDMVGPKFKVGDWIVNNISKDVFLIKSINNGYCTLEDINGNIIYPCLPPCESESHLWSIEDSKDGDVLVSSKNQPFIHNGCRDKSCLGAYCGINVNNEFKISDNSNSWIKYNWTFNKGTKPATKEQRDQLEKAMADAGWEFDFEKKELKEIVDKEQIKKYLQDNSFRRMFEQKPIIDGILTATNYDKMFQNCKVHKFNVGDWYVNQGKTYHLLSIDSGYWTIEDTDGNKYSPCLPPHESESHLWSIQDAKPGDVLVTGNAPFLYSGHDDNGYGIVCFSYGGISSNRDEFIINTNPENPWCDVKFVKPAPKERRELLFQKMHEAG